MAVHYTGGGGGLLDTLGKAISMGAMAAVPGLQAVAPYVAGAGSLAKGDIGGAIGSMAAPMVGKAVGGAMDNVRAAAQPNESLMGALQNAYRSGSGMEDWQIDPKTGRRLW